MQQIAIPRWQHRWKYWVEVFDLMNGGTFKKNEDGTYSATFTRIRPDRVANALRRVFYLTLTGAVAMIGQQSRAIPQYIQEALSPKSFAIYLRDPEVKAAFADLIREMVVVPEQPVEVKPKPSKRVLPPRPKGGAMLREGEIITIEPPFFLYSSAQIESLRKRGI
jgi:hypothetical protein